MTLISWPPCFDKQSVYFVCPKPRSRHCLANYISSDLLWVVCSTSKLVSIGLNICGGHQKRLAWVIHQGSPYAFSKPAHTWLHQGIDEAKQTWKSLPWASTTIWKHYTSLGMKWQNWKQVQSLMQIVSLWIILCTEASEGWPKLVRLNLFTLVTETYVNQCNFPHHGDWVWESAVEGDTL